MFLCHCFIFSDFILAQISIILFFCTKHNTKKASKKQPAPLCRAFMKAQKKKKYVPAHSSSFFFFYKLLRRDKIDRVRIFRLSAEFQSEPDHEPSVDSFLTKSQMMLALIRYLILFWRTIAYNPIPPSKL